MNDSIAEIRGIIEEIEMTENLILKLRQGAEGIVLDGMLGEMLRKKRNLVRELLSGLVHSGIDFKEFKNLYKMAFEYLEKTEEVATKPNPDLKVLFKKAENFIGANG